MDLLSILRRLLEREGHLDLDYDYESETYWVGKHSGRTLIQALKRATEEE